MGKVHAASISHAASLKKKSKLMSQVYACLVSTHSDGQVHVLFQSSHHSHLSYCESDPGVESAPGVTP